MPDYNSLAYHEGNKTTKISRKKTLGIKPTELKPNDVPKTYQKISIPPKTHVPKTLNIKSKSRVGTVRSL